MRPKIILKKYMLLTMLQILTQQGFETNLFRIIYIYIYIYIYIVFSVVMLMQK